MKKSRATLRVEKVIIGEPEVLAVTPKIQKKMDALINSFKQHVPSNQ